MSFILILLCAVTACLAIALIMALIFMKDAEIEQKNKKDYALTGRNISGVIGEKSAENHGEEALVKAEDNMDSIPNEFSRELIKIEYKNKYVEFFNNNPVAKDAKEVVLVSNIFSLKNQSIVNYVWKSEDSLRFFPKWSSVEEQLMRPSNKKKMSSDYSDNIFQIKIPFSAIRFYDMRKQRGLNHVILVHKDSFNDNKSLIFSPATYSVFKEMLPEKERATIAKREYAKSRNNVLDLQENIKKLEQRLISGEIDREEFNKRRKELLVNI